MSNLPAIPDDVIPGMEDYNPETDSKMPIIRVVSREGVFKDSLTGETFKTFEGVVLADVKGRVLWDPDLDESSSPMCRSLDFEHGRPSIKDFPWPASGFKIQDYPEGSVLPCDSCILKDWNSHPHGGKKPWCAEQHTFIVMRLNAQGRYIPALITFTRTSVTPAKDYMTGFRNQGQPMFVTTTHFGLEMRKKGTNDYSVVTLKRGESTDESFHAEWIDKYRAIRLFLTTPRNGDEDAEVEAPVTNPGVTAPEQPAVTPAPEQPAPAPQEQPAPVAPPEQPAAPQPTPPEEPAIEEADVVEPSTAEPTPPIEQPAPAFAVPDLEDF